MAPRRLSPGTTVSVVGAGSNVALGGGGSASTAAGSGSAGAPTVFVDDAAVFSANNLAISSAGAQDAGGVLVRNGAQATLGGGSITTVGTNSPAAMVAMGGTLNASGTTVAASGAQAPALLLDGSGALVQFAGGALGNASGGTVTSGPTSSTMPMNSWPRMSPSCMVGILPR